MTEPKSTQSFTMIFQRIIPFLVLAVLALFTGCNSDSGSGFSSGATADLGTSIDSVSYSVGYQIGSGMQQQGMDDVDFNNLLAGLQDALGEESGEPQISQQQMRSILQNYQMQKQQQAMQRQQEEAKQNIQKGQEFLAENAKEEGVRETQSGLQYKVLEEGSGASPEASDSVVVHYRGTLLDGTQFDSSYERDEPASFQLNQVIEGWTEGLQLMQEGATYKFWIPSDLAYGNRPRPGGPIKPGQTLVFEVELLEVK